MLPLAAVLTFDLSTGTPYEQQSETVSLVRINLSPKLPLVAPLLYLVSLPLAGVVKFDPATGKQFKGKSPTQTYTTYFAEALIAEAEQDKRVVAIHAAMGGGTGLNLVSTIPCHCSPPLLVTVAGLDRV